LLKRRGVLSRESGLNRSGEEAPHFASEFFDLIGLFALGVWGSDEPKLTLKAARRPIRFWPQNLQNSNFDVSNSYAAH
jgi:hypothetical protein